MIKGTWRAVLDCMLSYLQRGKTLSIYLSWYVFQGAAALWFFLFSLGYIIFRDFFQFRCEFIIYHCLLWWALPVAGCFWSFYSMFGSKLQIHDPVWRIVLSSEVLQPVFLQGATGCHLWMLFEQLAASFCNERCWGAVKSPRTIILYRKSVSHKELIIFLCLWKDAFQRQLWEKGYTPQCRRAAGCTFPNVELWAMRSVFSACLETTSSSLPSLSTWR